MATPPRQTLLSHVAAVAKAMGHPHRLAILEMLGQGERSVERVAQLVDLSLANASQHLQQMRRSGLVSARKRGKQVLYRLSDDAVVIAVGAIRRIAERQAGEVERVLASCFRERDALEPVSRRELLRRIRDGLVTVLDVRPAEEFNAGHLPKAINIPLPELRSRLRELSSRREVVAYCRGPYCLLAFDAIAALRKRGFRARRLEDGFPEWKAAGLPVERLA